MKTSHTPGPWEINFWSMDKEPAYMRRWNIGTNTHLVAECVVLIQTDKCNHGIPKEMFNANIALLAAAPDLLSALVAAEEYLSFGATENSKPFPLDKVRAAIAKAKGGTP